MTINKKIFSYKWKKNNFFRNFLAKGNIFKALFIGRKNQGGRSYGRITCAKRGAIQKRKILTINAIQNKENNVRQIILGEYKRRKPTADIYISGNEKGSIQLMLAPEKTKIYDRIVTNATAPRNNGDRGPLEGIKPGTAVHNVTSPWNNGGISRSRGESTLLIRHDAPCSMLKCKSGEIRYCSNQYQATIGTVSDPNYFLKEHRKAGYTRHIGRNPRSRPTAMNPVDHPLGGRTKGGSQAVDQKGKLRNNKRTRKHLILGILSTVRTLKFAK